MNYTNSGSKTKGKGNTMPIRGQRAVKNTASKGKKNKK